MFSTILR